MRSFVTDVVDRDDGTEFFFRTPGGDRRRRQYNRRDVGRFRHGSILGRAVPSELRILAISVRKLGQVYEVACRGVRDLERRVDDADGAADVVRELLEADADLIVIDNGCGDGDAMRLLASMSAEHGIRLALGWDGESATERGQSGWAIPGRQVWRLGSKSNDPGSRADDILRQAKAGLPVVLDLLAQFPSSLMEITEYPGGAINRYLVDAHRRRGLPIPKRVPKQEIAGPRPHLSKPGIFHDVHHFDFRSFYPNIIKAFLLAPDADRCGAFHRLATNLQGLRDKHDGNEGCQLIKRLASAMSGCLNGAFEFSDPDKLGDIYGIGDELLAKMLGAIRAGGGDVLWHQTDGALAIGIKNVGQVVASIATEAGQHHPVHHEGPFSVLLLGVHERILRGADGQLIWKGEAPKGVESAASAKLVHALLDGDDDAARQAWRRGAVDVEVGHWNRFLNCILRALGAARFERVFGGALRERYEQQAASTDGYDQAEFHRTQNQEGRKARLRLPVLERTVLPPCVDKVREALRKDEPVTQQAVEKATAELRIAGNDHDAVIKRLVPKEAAYRRLRSMGVLFGPQDAPLLARRYWAHDATDQSAPSCRHAAVQTVCKRDRCYRQRTAPTFRETAYTPEQYTKRARAEVGQICMLPRRFSSAVHLVQAGCRTGKTYRLSGIAKKEADAGQRVWIVVPDHRAAAEVMKELREAGLTGYAAVHLHGRPRPGDPQQGLCSRPGERSCSGCPLGHIKGRVDRKRGVFDQSRLAKEAQGSKSGEPMCGRTLSRKMASTARVVVLTFSSFVSNPPKKRPDVILVDEADLLASHIARTCTESMPLVQCRTRKDRHFDDVHRCAGSECKSCHIQLPLQPGEKEGNEALVQIRLQRDLPEPAAHEEPALFIDSLRHGLMALEATCMSEGVSVHLGPLHGVVDALEEALRALAPDPLHPDRNPRERIRELRAQPLTAWEWSESGGGFVLRLPESPDLLERLQDLKGLDGDALLARQFAAFIASAANEAGELLLEPRPKPGTWASFQAGCEVRLSYFKHRKFQELVGGLRRARSLMVSGTFGDRRIARARLLLSESEASFQAGVTPMHGNFTVFCHEHLGRGRLPKGGLSLDAKGLLELLVEVESHTDGPFKVLVFATSKRRAESLYNSMRVSRDVEIRLLYSADYRAPRISSGAAISVDIDYLRSRESRAVNRDYDFIVVHGTGTPNYESFGPWARAIERVTGDVIHRDELALEDRRGAVAQALLRHAGQVDGGRVALLIGDHRPADLPDYVTTRAHSTHDLLGSGSPETKLKTLARVIGKALGSDPKQPHFLHRPRIPGFVSALRDAKRDGSQEDLKPLTTMARLLSLGKDGRTFGVGDVAASLGVVSDVAEWVVAVACGTHLLEIAPGGSDSMSKFGLFGRD